MKRDSAVLSLPTAPAAIAEAQRYLIGAFTINLAVTVIYLIADRAALLPPITLVFYAVLWAAQLLVAIAIYIAARRLGWGTVQTLLLIVVALFAKHLWLILVLYTNKKMSERLKSLGWQVGLFGATQRN